MFMSCDKRWAECKQIFAMLARAWPTVGHAPKRGASYIVDRVDLHEIESIGYFGFIESTLGLIESVVYIDLQTQGPSS